MRFATAIPGTGFVGTVLLPLAVVLTVVSAPRPVVAGDHPLRRIVLISCDTLRASALSCYGNAGTTTTGLDSLAGRGTLFLNCVTPMGWTLPAHMSLLTGLNPGSLRVGADRALPAGIPLLTEVLTENGFVAGGFVAENKWMSADFGFNRGFRQYRAQLQLAPIRDWTRLWSFADALGTDASFFLFFHFMDTHTVPVAFEHRLPYWAIRDIDRLYHGLKDPLPEIKVTPDNRWDLPAYDREILRKAYDSATFSLDYLHIRPLLQHLREQGLADGTMFIVTADHGEELGEHGGYLHDSPHEEVRHVPLLVVWPGVVPAGRVVYDQVNLIDIMPTVLDYAELPLPTPIQGLSLRPLLEAERGTLPARDFLVDGHRRGLGLQPSALVAWSDDVLWSLVALTDTTGCAGDFEPARVAEVTGLYNLDLDPDETDDQRAAFPALVAELTARMNRMLADEARLSETLNDGDAAPDVRLDEEDRRELRALGY